MKIIDLTHTVTMDMPVFPGCETPQLTQIGDHGLREMQLTISSHTGTHVDAPAHVLKDHYDLDALGAGCFVGKALVVSVPSRTMSITEDHLTSFWNLQESIDFLLFQTGWDRLWGKPEYFTKYPVLSTETATRLCDFALKGVGFDTVSADAAEDQELPIHRILLSSMIIVENLTNLGLLPETPVLFSCLPLKIAGGDGSPVRAIAMIDVITGADK